MLALDVFLTSFQQVRSQFNLLLLSGAFTTMATFTAAIAAILGLTTGKNKDSKLIPTPGKVGRPVDVTGGLDFDEFDIIIVGGGTPVPVMPCCC